VLRYIAGSVDYGLDNIIVDGVSLVVYTDSERARCATDRKSASGCCFCSGSGLVSWRPVRPVARPFGFVRCW
jgi:hypothetical protein